MTFEGWSMTFEASANFFTVVGSNDQCAFDCYNKKVLYKLRSPKESCILGIKCVLGIVLMRICLALL